MIEVKVDSIQVSLMTEHRVIILKDINAEWYLPIWIGPYEAEAIAIRLQNIEVARPLTHDLLNNVITEMGGKVSHIVVDDLRSDTFYASITVNLNGRQLKIDSRPSDAIALAVRANVPIFVEEDVMAQAGIVPETDVSEGADEEELSAFRDFINNLDLDDLPLQ
ncbi:MAG: bifunctional nuclease family protein [Chloroflexi bacterium]|nr:MAG: bifunctional nuclease family protein [Chloroflexota bacterium]RLC87215.1 MAG: bifunctional nuclease family protein [Chloroflexota bacterium]HEY67386.1 bifunctional nuclease family protein [Thermoflexia bacterium]